MIEQTLRPRILVVEDDAATYSALRILLSKRGADVVLATTLTEARAALREGIPDSIVLDLMLPDGDGIEILRDIRARKLKTRIAVTTGVSDPDHLTAVANLHPDATLKKPIDLAELLRTIL
jgi:DNA-binding response OmpR family regulator